MTWLLLLAVLALALWLCRNKPRQAPPRKSPRGPVKRRPF